MPTLFITEPHATLRLRDRALVVTGAVNGRPDPDRELLRVAAERLEQVVLVGNVHVTADATHFCLDLGVGLSWLTSSGRLRGRLVPEAPRSADLRLAQYAAAVQPGQRLARARALVTAKLHSAAQVLADIYANHPEVPVEDRQAHALAEQAEAVPAAASLESLFGVEGNGARIYFAALAPAFRGDIPFTGRTQHPPPDPANALLSFGYVLLGNHMAGLLEARGLDPALGFYHEVKPGRHSLALDLLEEFRHAVVDRFVLRVCNLRIFKPDMFQDDDERPGGVRMTRPGLQRFFLEWDKYLKRPLPDADESQSLAVGPLLRRQVERLVADLRGGSPYRPFRFLRR